MHLASANSISGVNCSSAPRWSNITFWKTLRMSSLHRWSSLPCARTQSINGGWQWPRATTGCELIDAPTDHCSLHQKQGAAAPWRPSMKSSVSVSRNMLNSAMLGCLEL